MNIIHCDLSNLYISNGDFPEFHLQTDLLLAVPWCWNLFGEFGRWQPGIHTWTIFPNVSTICHGSACTRLNHFNKFILMLASQSFRSIPLFIFVFLLFFFLSASVIRSYLYRIIHEFMAINLLILPIMVMESIEIRITEFVPSSLSIGLGILHRASCWATFIFIPLETCTRPKVN